MKKIKSTRATRWDRHTPIILCERSSQNKKVLSLSYKPRFSPDVRRPDLGADAFPMRCEKIMRSSIIKKQVELQQCRDAGDIPGVIIQLNNSYRLFESRSKR